MNEKVLQMAEEQRLWSKSFNRETGKSTLMEKIVKMRN